MHQNIQWDGKILHEIVGSEKANRLPELVSRDGVDKLLGVPKLTVGKSHSRGKDIYDLLMRWGMVD